MALVVADAAAHAVEFVGLPEAQLNLAQAVVHLATAPKSNRSRARHLAGPRGRAQRAVGGEVPVHLRDAHYRAAAQLGHGAGYDYPHDDPEGWVRAAVPPRRARGPHATTSPRPTASSRRSARRMEPQADDAGRATDGDA